jgi:hypothetical protein
MDVVGALGIPCGTNVGVARKRYHDWVIKHYEADASGLRELVEKLEREIRERQLLLAAVRQPNGRPV